jgi:hypothetical protein
MMMENIDKKAEQFEAVLKNTADLYDSFDDKEEFWARQHWVNNPLIKPKSKAQILHDLEESALAAGEFLERKRIKALILDFCTDEHSVMDLCSCGDLITMIDEDDKSGG